jgi:transcriptional regulator with XRE-family HTH domain
MAKKKTVKGKTRKAAARKTDKNSRLGVLGEFYSNLKKAVSDTGLSAYSLAKKLGVNDQSISNLLRGDRDPKLSTVIQIAKGMRVSVDDLAGISDRAIPAESSKDLSLAAGEIKFNGRAMKMYKPDIDLLEGIAVLLEKRREQAVLKLATAIRGKSGVRSLAARSGRLNPPAETGDDEWDALDDPLKDDPEWLGDDEDDGDDDDDDDDFLDDDSVWRWRDK